MDELIKKFKKVYENNPYAAIGIKSDSGFIILEDTGENNGTIGIAYEFEHYTEVMDFLDKAYIETVAEDLLQKFTNDELRQIAKLIT